MDLIVVVINRADIFRNLSQVKLGLEMLIRQLLKPDFLKFENIF